MQISKIAFLIFSILFIISCGEKSKTIEHGMPTGIFKDRFLSNQTSSEYLIEGNENSLIMKLSGSLRMNIHTKELKKFSKGRKCLYHEDTKKEIEVHFQSENAHDFFEFTIDGNPLEYRFLPGGEILFYIPKNSKILKLSLKNEFLKKYTLFRYQTKRDKRCRYYRSDGTAPVTIMKKKLSVYQRFIAINYEFKVQPSYLH